MGNEQSAIALLLFRVGPVLCCAPADPVQSIITPVKLTHPPGSNDARPGIFYHADHVVSVSDLHHRFGINETEREQPGRLIITLQGEAFIAYWVDKIIEVIDTPTQGWSEPSSHLPQGVFSKTLLLDEKIYLFADFAQFENLPESGYLSQYIDKLAGGLPAAETAVEVIEDKPEVQANTTASPEVAAPPVTENVTMALTEAPDTGQNSAQVSGADDGEDDKTTVQATRQQPSGEEERDVSETPPLEPADPHTEEEDEKIVSAEADELETPFSAAATSDITTPDSLAQTESSLDDIKNDNEPDSTTIETFEARPESIAAPPPEAIHLEHVKEETEKSIPETTTPAEKTTGLKTGYLDPVPAVVPESEQEPEKPPFPWQNLAAAVVLFMTVAGIGIYYSWSSSDKTTTRQAINPQAVMTQQRDVSRNEKPAPSRHEDEDEDATETDSVPDAESLTVTATDDQHDNNSVPQDENEYRAEIKPDIKGVTIVLHSPENEPVFKATKQALIEKPATQKDMSVPAKKPEKKTKPNKQEIIHIVVKGDTLWAIAERYVNDPYKYSSLAKLSKIKNPDRIYPGNRVRILRHTRNAK